MKDWFQVQMLDDTTYVISEHKHYEKTNCYLLLGKQRALLIDSGLGVADIRKITDQLTALPVTVIATHVHWDHIGSHGSYTDVLVHEREYSWLNGVFPLPLNVVKQQLMKEPCSFPGDFHLDAYTAVSYTHLDVYKRQGYQFTGERRESGTAGTGKIKSCTGAAER